MTDPSTETAVVWRYGARRYLTKRAAFMAQAKDILREGHEKVSSDDMEIGGACYCEYCVDQRDNGGALKFLASELMRESRKVAHD